MKNEAFEFDNKVKSMTSKQIIEAMVNGIKNKHVEIDMNTFGAVEDGICYGCAATNAICEIYGAGISESSILETRSRASYVNSSYTFLDKFEYAIDHLRSGCIDSYNNCAKQISIAKIKEPDWWLDEPLLMKTHNYESLLPVYQALAEYQEDETVEYLVE